MTEYGFLKAMSDISDELVEEAAENFKPDRIGRTRLAAIAACIAMFLVLGAPIIPFIFDNTLPPSHSKPPTDGGASPGDTSSGVVAGMIEDAVASSGKVSFVFYVDSAQAHSPFFTLSFSVDGEDIIITDDPSFSSDSARVIIARDILTVNGVPATSLPTECGRYEVEVDYGHMLSANPERLSVVGFGTVVLG